MTLDDYLYLYGCTWIQVQSTEKIWVQLLASTMYPNPIVNATIAIIWCRRDIDRIFSCIAVGLEIERYTCTVKMESDSLEVVFIVSLSLSPLNIVLFVLYHGPFVSCFYRVQKSHTRTGEKQREYGIDKACTFFLSIRKISLSFSDKDAFSIYL